MSSPTGAPDKIFALVDCNNFFVSCERLFQPALRSRPVAVLSNNDGCVVARSNEVKAMGIAMGDPYFKQERLLRAHNTAVFSANFSLYGDISERVVATLKRFSPNIEVYSIDECFLQIDNLAITDYDLWAKEVAETVETEVGVPVSVGVAPTKTLAKIATERAKKIPEHRGGCSLVGNASLQEEALRWLPLEDVWGIGRRRGRTLHRLGLRTAYDVTQLRDEWVLDQMTITGLKMVRELRGESCIPLEDFAANYQQKMASSTRSFGRKVRSLAELEAAIASLSARAAMRLRRKDQLAWRGSTFVRASLPDRSTRYISANFRLAVPTAFTGDITKGAHQALQQLYDPIYRYEKGGVILHELVDVQAQQMSLFDQRGRLDELQKQDDLMAAVDNLSLRYGKGAVVFAAEKAGPGKWHSKQSKVTPMYTTRWEHLPTVKLYN